MSFKNVSELNSFLADRDLIDGHDLDTCPNCLQTVYNEDRTGLVPGLIRVPISDETHADEVLSAIDSAFVRNGDVLVQLDRT